MEKTNKDSIDTSYILERTAYIDEETHKKFIEKKWVWVAEANGEYVKGWITRENDGVVEIDCDSRIITAKISDVFKMNPPKFDMADDLAALSHLNEPSVLYNLKRRYQNNLIYTYSGLFLLAINPYRNLKIYGDKEVKRYTLNKKCELEPHIYAVANDAYNLMLSTREDQSILITGESGAGKTENTKKVIEFLAKVAGTSSKMDSNKIGDGIDQQIIDANPVLEAFGNAQTIKNDNSSRFGKFIQIKFNGGNICGAHIEKYLLEKSRITSQNRDERNYHIFYQLLKGASDELREELFLGKNPSEYNFLRNSKYTIENVDDAQEFINLRKAMSVLKINEDEQMRYFRIVAAILHLGNIEFREKNEVAEIVNLDCAEKVCKLLNVPLSDFIICLLHPVIKAGNEFITHNRTKEQVLRLVEALAKILYDKMFDNVIDRLNFSLGTSSGTNQIGVLDIAGFEIFKENSFEQLCINYTNEKLQQFFNHHMFILEQEIYKQENIDWDFIDFGLDLEPTIDLIEKSNPIGILSYLDEECVMPKANEETFLSKLKTIKNPKFDTMKLKSGFIINHYAGNVEYKVDNWISKNKDPNSEALTTLIESSDTLNLNLSETTGKRGYFRTVSQKHKEQLAALMTQLSRTNPHFVRCIIPNLQKSGEFLENSLILEQLKCNGVLEGIRISRQGFPSRMKYQEFVDRYIMLTDSIKGDYNNRQKTKEILEIIKINQNQYRLGNTKIFFRQGILADIEDLRDGKIANIVREIQALIRKRLTYRKYHLTKRRMDNIKLIQKNALHCCEVQKWNWWKLYQKVKPLLDVGRRDQEMKEMEKSMEEKLKSLSEQKEIVKNLEKTVELLNSEKSSLIESIENEKRFSEEKNELLMALRLKNEELETSIKNHTAELDKMDKNKKHIENDLNTLKAELETLIEKNKKLNEVNNEQVEIINDKENQISTMKTQLTENVTESKAQMESLLCEKMEEIQKLRKNKNLEIEELKEKHDQISKKLVEEKQELEKSNETILKLKQEIDGLKKWKIDYNNLQESYNGMQRKLKDENGDLQLENDRMCEDLRKIELSVKELRSENKRLVEGLELEKMKGDKLEKVYQNLKNEYQELEIQLEKEKSENNLRDSTHDSLLAQIKNLEKKLKNATEKYRSEETINKQIMAEKEEMYKEIHLLQQAKLDEIFQREAEFNTTKKGLQMEIKRLESENQRLNRQIADQRQAASETSEESTSAVERLYILLEDEKKGRKAVERYLAEQENINALLKSQLEELKTSLESERTATNTIRSDYEEVIGKNNLLNSIEKEMENIINTINIALEGFDSCYYKSIENYKTDVTKLENELIEKTKIINELNQNLEKLNEKIHSDNTKLKILSSELSMTSNEYKALSNEISEIKSKNDILDNLLIEKTDEVTKYKNLVTEFENKISDLEFKFNQELELLMRSDNERRRIVEELQEKEISKIDSIKRIEEKYKTHSDNTIKYALDNEKRKYKLLQDSYDLTLKNLTEVQQKYQELLTKFDDSTRRSNGFEIEINKLKGIDSANKTQLSLLESELQTLRKSSKFVEESQEKNKCQYVVYVSDKDALKEIVKNKNTVEEELNNIKSENIKIKEANALQSDEIESYKEEIRVVKEQLSDIKRENSLTSVTLKQLTRELNDEKEMIKFLKPFSLLKKKKN